MSRKSTRLLKAALSALHYTGTGGMLARYTGGDGVIFTLHHVRPEAPEPFEPNRILKITPEFLETVIQRVIEDGFEVLSLDEIPGRLANPEGRRPFACFTFDDGYRDNRDFALPVFKKFGLPFGLYVPTDYPDRKGDLWWLTLEAVIRAATSVAVTQGGKVRHFATGSTAEKETAYYDIYWWLRRLPEIESRAIVAGLAAQHGIDGVKLANECLMTWDELRDLSREPLVTIGAHTCSHFALAKLSDDDARREIVDSVARLEQELGKPCRHFSYPYGDATSAGPRDFALAADLGLTTAVTTEKGLIHAHHRAALTALPRVSLNGDYQDSRYLKVLLSGAPFAFRDVVKRLAGARPRQAAAFSSSAST